MEQAGSENGLIDFCIEGPGRWVRHIRVHVDDELVGLLAGFGMQPPFAASAGVHRVTLKGPYALSETLEVCVPPGERILLACGVHRPFVQVALFRAVLMWAAAVLVLFGFYFTALFCNAMALVLFAKDMKSQSETPGAALYLRQPDEPAVSRQAPRWTIGRAMILIAAIAVALAMAVNERRLLTIRSIWQDVRNALLKRM